MRSNISFLSIFKISVQDNIWSGSIDGKLEEFLYPTEIEAYDSLGRRYLRYRLQHVPKSSSVKVGEHVWVDVDALVDGDWNDHCPNLIKGQLSLPIYDCHSGMKVLLSERREVIATEVELLGIHQRALGNK